MIPPEGSPFYGHPDARETYRYWLHRDLCTGQGEVLFIMLNPSDALSLGNVNDVTVSRCIHFARSLGRRYLTVVNLFALRASKPERLLEDTIGCIGEHNDAAIEWAIQSIHDANGMVICAWGEYGTLHCRNCYVLGKLGDLQIAPHCFGLTKWRQPKHPRRLRNDANVVVMEPIR